MCEKSFSLISYTSLCNQLRRAQWPFVMLKSVLAAAYSAGNVAVYLFQFEALSHVRRLLRGKSALISSSGERKTSQIELKMVCQKRRFNFFLSHNIHYSILFIKGLCAKSVYEKT